MTSMSENSPDLTDVPDPLSGGAATSGGATPDGGAAGTESGAPIGFTADFGEGVPATSNPDEIDVPAASEHGPVTDSERAEQDAEQDDDA